MAHQQQCQAATLIGRRFSLRSCSKSNANGGIQTQIQCADDRCRQPAHLLTMPTTDCDSGRWRDTHPY